MGILSLNVQELYQLVINLYWIIEEEIRDKGYNEIEARYIADLWMWRSDINEVYDYINDNLGSTYDNVESFVETMLYDTSTKLYDVTHLFDLDVDEGLSYVTTLLGFDVDTYNNRIVSMEGDILHQMYDLEVKVDTEIDGLRNYVFNTLEPRILVLEEMLVTLTPEQIADLKYVMENAGVIADIIQGNVSFIIDEVEKGIDATVAAQVANAIQPYEARLLALEEITLQHQWFFAEYIFSMIAQWLAPQQAMSDGLEGAIETICNWITSEFTRLIDNLKDELTYQLPAVEELPQHWIDALKLRLEITGNGNGGVSLADVQGIVNAAVAPLQSQINAVSSAVSGIQIPSEATIKKWIDENPATIKIADYIGAIDVLLAKQITDKIVLPADRISTVASYIIADTIARQMLIEESIAPITTFLTDDMRTSLTDIVDAFGTPEALVAYLVNAPEGQEVQMLDLMQVLITMTFERGMV